MPPRVKKTSPDGKPIWMPVYVAERVSDTSHLSAHELGCLERLEMSYWRSGPLRDNDEILSRVCGCSTGEFKKARPSLEKFFEVDGEWMCSRLDEEMRKACELIKKNKAKTATATLARKIKREAERNNQRNGARMEERDDNVTTEVTRLQLQVNSNTALAKGGNGSFEAGNASFVHAVSQLEEGWK